MLREFFLGGGSRQRCWAVGGLVAIVAHALLRAWVKYLMNDWMSRFYDVGGSASDVDSDDEQGLREGSSLITKLLVEFSFLCLPSVVIHPVFKWLTNRWVLSWRTALIRAYLSKWNQRDSNVDNAAQRIHEDTQRFARGLQTCCVVLLDSVLTIVVFAPILVNLGAEVQPSKLPGSWMLLMCAGVACAGVLVSVVLGWSLVALEIENQKAEANLRKQLVLEEERVQPGAGARRTDTADASVEYIDAAALDAIDYANVQRTQRLSLNHVFQPVVSAIIFNYRRLYYKFAVFSLWLGAYEQFVVILPYVITGPLLFATDRRITLGKVTQVSHAFGNVFDALNILSDRWIEVTDWVSVTRRLREFEESIGCRTGTRSSLIPATELASSSTLHVDRC